jgi:hypothetical protein
VAPEVSVIVKKLALVKSTDAVFEDIVKEATFP